MNPVLYFALALVTMMVCAYSTCCIVAFAFHVRKTTVKPTKGRWFSLVIDVLFVALMLFLWVPITTLSLWPILFGAVFGAGASLTSVHVEASERIAALSSFYPQATLREHNHRKHAIVCSLVALFAMIGAFVTSLMVAIELLPRA